MVNKKLAELLSKTDLDSHDQVKKAYVLGLEKALSSLSYIQLRLENVDLERKTVLNQVEMEMDWINSEISRSANGIEIERR